MSADAIKPIYVLHGQDAFLLDAQRQEILQHVVGEADPQTCVAVLEATAELAEVLDELRTLPFLAPRRVVMVRDADAFVSANREKIEEYLQSPSPTGTLVLIVISWPGNTRLAKLVASIGEVRECSLADQTKLAGWLAKAAGRRGKKIAPDAADLLAQWIGADLAALDSEIEKLSLYAGERGTIAAEDVLALVTATAGPAAFDLTNAITVGDAPAALKALAGAMLTRGAEFQTLGLIAWHLRRALQAQQQIAAGATPQRAVGSVRMPFSQQAAFQAFLKRRPLAAIQADFRRMIRADLGMKSGLEPVAALQELVVSLCT